MKSILPFLLLFFCIGFLKSQTTKTYLEESKPLSPSAYQFLKYTALPVSEYTGIPQVSVPVYEIKEDGITVPINLNYHASGITVSEEATSVGLGWNLQFGSVIQIVNDQNDLNPVKTKLLPDYTGSPIPSFLPLKYPNWPYETPGGPTSFPIIPVNADYTFPIATHNYFPVNGDYTIDQYGLFINSDYDSEPDIFKANFLGHSVNFIKDFKNGGQIIVLNKVGYKIEYLSSDSWRITVPSGEQYYFALKNVTSCNSTSLSVPTGSTTNTVNPESSVMWSLTKIVTKQKRTIIFNYLQTSSYQHIPAFSQTWKKAAILTSYNVGNTDNGFSAFWNLQLSTGGAGNLTTNTFFQSEAHTVPSSIVFPLGRVDFYNSGRDDVLGGKKIDSIAISGDQVRKVYKLQYNYFNSSAVGGNGFTYDTTLYGNRGVLRLKLTSLTDNTGGIYQFNYDTALLPIKTSYAQDQWGYYNGALTNTSLIPNPTQYNKPDLGNNGDNHSANEPYAKACSLKQIIYPTGGSVNFDFELNSFSNYFVPDYTSSSNTISHGNGLRVKEVTWKQADNSISKIQRFLYTDGKALLPVNLYRNYQLLAGTGVYNNVYAGGYFSVNNYFVDEFNANGYYSPSSLATMSGVGYSQVTTKMVDQFGNSLGAEVSTFNNTPAVLPLSSVQFMTRVSISVPGRESLDAPKNGLTKLVQYYDQQGNLKKKTAISYFNYPSSLFYGARIYNYGNYIFYVPPTGTSIGNWDSKLQYMVAEYPIYDFESLPDTVKEVDYLKAGDSVVTTTKNQYNGYRLLASSIKRGTNYKEETMFGYSYNDDDMTDAHRFSDLTYQYKSKINTTAAVPDPTPSDTHKFDRTFTQVNDSLFVPAYETDRTANHYGPETFYEHYDTYGNATQIKEHAGTTSLIWGYKGEYVIAKIANAAISDCAFTSFEEKLLEIFGDWQVFPSVPFLPRQGMANASYITTDSHAGILCSNATNIISKTLPAKDYIFTLYAKGTGTITVNSIAQTISGGWKRYDWYLTNATQVSLVSTGLLVDDLCVYPAGAQATTYTYKPLVGISSETDPKGKTSYYEYDNFQRLKNIKDQNGNIVKQFGYHLNGQ